MKTELLETAEESPSSNNSQFTSREKMEKLLGICLTRDKLLLLEHRIGADFEQLKQTLAGCFVRVHVQGRPMLAAIRSVKDSCQIEWAKFGRRLRLSDSLGYFEFDQVHSEMPKRKEIKRWCQRREQEGREPLSDEFIDEKRAQLNKFTNETDEPTKAEPQSEENVSSISEDEEFEEEEESTMRAEEMPELPNVEGLVRSRELLAKVLLPSDEFLRFFSPHANTKAVSLATAGCLMAFRIAGKVIVDEIVSVRQCERTNSDWDIHFKLGHAVNATNLLLAVVKSEITGQVFDQWLRHLAIRNEPVPSVHDKYKCKVHALAQLQIKFDNAERKKKQRITRYLKRMWDTQKLPNIAPLIVTGKQLQLLADNLALDELNRVLVGCFVTVKLRTRGLLVVPIKRVLMLSRTILNNNNFLYFASRIPIRHQKTGKPLVTELCLQNVHNKMLDRESKVLFQCLLTMLELDIFWPSEEEIAQKRAQLDAALAKAASSSSSHSSTSTTSNKRKSLQQPPASSATTSVLPHSEYRPVPIKQQRQKKRQIGTTENKAGNASDNYGKRQRPDF